MVASLLPALCWGVKIVVDVLVVMWHCSGVESGS